VLVLGLGGGSAARLVRALAPAARIVGVELNADVVRAARRHFALDALGLEIVQADAREYLASCRARFDAVIEDVFIGNVRSVRKPDWLLDGGLAAAARRVRPGGLLIVNTIDETAAVARTLVRAEFRPRLELRIAGWDNRVLVASSRALDAGTLRQRVRQSPLLAPALRKLSVRGR
jgi:spermidine synthase